MALKTIVEKQKISWDIIKKPKDIMAQVDHIIGSCADTDIRRPDSLSSDEVKTEITYALPLIPEKYFRKSNAGK